MGCWHEILPWEGGTGWPEQFWLPLDPWECSRLGWTLGLELPGMVGGVPARGTPASPSCDPMAGRCGTLPWGCRLSKPHGNSSGGMQGQGGGIWTC